jgi:ATP-dependent exoDNAse (exonuclease V) beta subunit
MKRIHIVEAGAGSGKTYRLAEEVFKAIARPGKDRVRPNGFILTTFTRKAASELLSRVSQRLIAEGKNDEAHLIRQSLIGTINSVCGSLLERFAFEAGLPVRMRVIPEGEDQHHFNNVLSTVINPDENERMHELSYMLEVEDWREVIQSVVAAARSNCIAAKDLLKSEQQSIKTATSVLPSPEGSMAACIKAAKVALQGLTKLVESGTDDTGVTSGAIELLKNTLRKLDIEQVLRWQDFHSMAKIGAGKRSGADDILHNLRLISGGHHTWPEFRQSIQDYIHLVFDISARSMDAFAEWKRSEELIDFVDQETLLLKLLDKPQVVKTMTDELDMLLVDEFQDTSPIQLALFMKLAECAKESIWVGDPKQAIYGFRDADPELMLLAVDKISSMEKGAGLDRLATSYRSVKPLVNFTNACFSTAFESQNIGKDRVVLSAARKDVPAAPSLESWVIAGRNKGDDASAIAGQIARILAEPDKHPVLDKTLNKVRPVRPGDIAVLCRVNDDCDLIASSLEGVSIPVERASVGLLSRPESVLALSGLRLLMDQNDTLAAARITYLVDVVKAGGSDEKWLESRLKETIAQKAGDEQSGIKGWKDHPTIMKVLEKSSQMKSMTPRMALHAACDLTDVWGFVRHLQDPQAGTANINRLLAYATEYEESCIVSGTSLTTAGLLQYFDVLSGNELDRIAHSGGDAVHVVTWHGAKGLEWPIVIVYSLDSKAENRFFSANAYTDGKFSLESPVADRRIRYVSLPYHRKSRNSVAYVAAMQPCKEYIESQQIADNEWLRLLYVVFTRARDYLIFAARANKVAGLEIQSSRLFDLPQDPNDCPKGWRVVPVLPSGPSGDASIAGRQWFPYTADRTPRPPAKVSPSLLGPVAQKHAGRVLSTEKLWEPIRLPDDIDKEIVGTAFHHYFAIDTAQLTREDRLQVASRIIAAHELSAAVAPDVLVRCGTLIDDWIARRWPGAVRRREWPLRMEHAGYSIEGQADVVLETPVDFSVIDFKTGTGSVDVLSVKAKGYSPQLLVYSEVIRIATGKACKAAVVCFPVAGLAMDLDIKEAGCVLSLISA